MSGKKQEFTDAMLKEALNYYWGNILITDGKGNILYANEGLCRLYDLSEEQILDMDVYQLVERGHLDRSACAEAIEKKKTVMSKLITGSGVEVGCVARPILDENNNVYMVAIYSQDEVMVKRLSQEITIEREKNKNTKQTISYLQQNNYRRNIIAADPRMSELYRAVESIAKTDSTIMLYGESGTGKEVMARYIHKASDRSSDVFIPINCAAIPSELMEAEFFGYEKGAFTGANKEGKAGIFEMANNGTLFLDELGELSMPIQSKFLRIIESGEVMRVGSSKTIKTDVRIIAATNRNLKKMMNEKKFREDLYYRLNVIPITIPPLRERPKDIEALVSHFINIYNKKYNCVYKIGEEKLKKFLEYEWPGNIRELRNEIERLVIINKGDYDISEQITDKSDLNSKNADAEYQNIPTVKTNLKDALKEYEKKLILKTLDECEGKIGVTAQKLGIHRSVLFRKLRDIKLYR